MFDLIMLDDNGERSIFAAYLDEDGREWRSSLYPTRGAFAPIAEEIMRDFPGMFATQQDVELFLTTIHFRNMTSRQNAGGQDYPIKKIRGSAGPSAVNPAPE